MKQITIIAITTTIIKNIFLSLKNMKNQCWSACSGGWSIILCTENRLWAQFPVRAQPGLRVHSLNGRGVYWRHQIHASPSITLLSPSSLTKINKYIPRIKKNT